MSGPGDIGGEVSGDEAAWRDLVARFDVPTDRTTAVVPWPAVEDLPHPAPPPGPAGPARTPGSSAERHVSPADSTGTTAETERKNTDPAGPPADSSGRTAAQAGPSADRPGRGAVDADGRSSDLTSDLATDRPSEPQGTASPPEQISGSATSFAIPADRTRVVRSASLPRSYTPPEDADKEQYVPEPLPPPGRLDTASKAALAGVVGGPGYLLVATIFLHWTISPEAALIAVAAFVAGFVTLIIKLGDRSGRDDDDDGAVL
jgi:hypothetical protein